MSEDPFEALKRAMLPTSFGKQKATPDKEKPADMSAFEKTKKIDENNPFLKPKGNVKKPNEMEDGGKDSMKDSGAESKDKGDADADEDDGEEAEDEEGSAPEVIELPVTHEILLKGHTKTVSALCLDPSGSRLISGSYDHGIKFWDFNGMDSTLRPFRSLEEPCGSYLIRCVQFSNTGDSFLVAPSSAQAKLFDREGHLQFECVKGDQYIRDMTQTKGHVASLTTCQWHPNNKQLFMTTAEDSTIRIWDVDYPKKHKDIFVYKTSKPSVRNSVTSATFSSDGKTIAAAGSHGSLRIYSTAGPFHRPEKEIESAHMFGSETSSVKFSRDGLRVYTRGGDDTMKIWDVRNFSKALQVIVDLPNTCLQTECTLSPDERFLATGTSAHKGQEHGKLILYDTQTFERIYETNVSPSNAARICWHSKLNQIMVGNGNGTVSVFYSPKSSVNGAKLCVVKNPKMRKQTEFTGSVSILTPHALPMFQEKRVNLKRQREKIRSDPLLSHKPEKPVTGPGSGGRVNNTNFTHHIMKTLNKDTSRDEDPREALLKYAKIAEENPIWVNHAYKKNQPTKIFNEEEDENELELQRPK